MTALPILHGQNLSPFVRKVRVALAHKGIEYEAKQTIPFGAGPEFLKLSPLSKIPCWEEGDLVLPDSSVILGYLEHKYPEPALMPSDPGLRARALWFEEYADTKLAICLATIFFQRFVRPNFFKQEPDEALIKNTMENELPPALDYIAEQLGDNDFLVDNTFSVADIASTSPFVNFRLGGGEVDTDRWPTVVAYVERVFEQPSYAPIVKADLGG